MIIAGFPPHPPPTVVPLPLKGKALGSSVWWSPFPSRGRLWGVAYGGPPSPQGEGSGE